MVERLVHLIDDEESFRRSASFLLKTSGYRVQAWPSGASFLANLRGLERGCVLLDARMPDQDGLSVLAELRERGGMMPVIMVTGHGDIPLAVQAMKLGAIDFLTKPFERSAILSALDKGFERMEDHGASGLQRDEARRMLRPLTDRELQVLQGLVRGLPNKSIAYDLGISARTVEVHRARAMAKLHARSLSEALKIAFLAGIDEMKVVKANNG